MMRLLSLAHPMASTQNRNSGAYKMNEVISLDDEKTKALLTEIMVDLIKNKREVLHEIMLDALEEVGSANAIIEGSSVGWVAAFWQPNIIHNS
jgi:predicted butyrate kinase (DUF1464 family)